MNDGKKVYSYRDVDIISDEIQSEEPIIIEGFPGIGLIGNITSQHIVSELNAEHRGIMNSRFFPPVAILTNGEITSPVRIYECTEKNLVILLSNVVVDPIFSYDVGKAIVDWAQEINMQEMVSLAGIITMSGEQKVFGGATNEDLLDKIKEFVELFEAGTIAGIPGTVMAECFARKLPGIGLLGETSTPNPDPRAAAEVVNTLNSIYGWDIKVDKLLEEAEKIELELQKLAEEMKTGVDGVPIPRRDLPMYG
ncbi:MAG: proteasome assembly chaperone family protein [Halobacteriota archaeon]|nr:proteasome assembly chaperone family protein [Halobacteriota archaeon]